MAYTTHSGDFGRCGDRAAPVASGAGAKLKQTVRKLPEFGVREREERAVREWERLGLVGPPDAT